MDRMADAAGEPEGSKRVNGYHIHIQGRVQGVGFRPFIYREALKHGWKGSVANTLDGVHLYLYVEENPDIEDLLEWIREKAPPQARIDRIHYRKLEAAGIPQRFSIAHSGQEGRVNMALSPDFALCAECRNDLLDPQNRRYHYPFITCTNCGPRFSIIQKLPYDRPFTTMEPFKQCMACAGEYDHPEDRRFYSQTNSCPECPVTLTLLDRNGARLPGSQEEIIEILSHHLLNDKILAIKGVGGYLLMADAFSEKAIRNLRARKNRPAKPFALMYPDAELAARDVVITDEVRKAWESPESPIVLSPLKPDHHPALQVDLIAPGLEKMGVMMPYAPLFVLIMKKLQQPAIATSGNISGSPVIYRDEKALEDLGDVADLFLVNDREIVVPQDDSVIQFSPFSQTGIILRRARGMAPGLSISPDLNMDRPVFAAGAMLKSSFGMYHEGRYYLSQYLGDTSDLDALESYEAVAAHMMKVLDFRPEEVITDLHPDYPATQYGDELARRLGIPVRKMQHHKAHALAVMGEHGLFDEEEVLNVVWDGTGLGEDHRIWGGEFFRYEKGNLMRIAHLPPFSHLAGDKMSGEPRLSALSLFHAWDEAGRLEKKFDEREWNTYRQLLKGDPLETTSAGRLFDAVASMLGLTDLNHYEGQAAMLLEAMATSCYRQHPGTGGHYEIGLDRNGTIDLGGLLQGIIKDLDRGTGKEEIAFRFHVSMVELVNRMARIMNIGRITFSGGVFQNALLVDLLKDRLDGDYRLYFHEQLSPNDESIPFGQLMAARAGWKQAKKLIEEQIKE